MRLVPDAGANGAAYGEDMQSRPDTLVYAYLPVFDVSDSVAVVVEADAQTTWDALMGIDLVDVGLQ